MAYKILCIDESGLTGLKLSVRLKDLDILLVNAKDSASVYDALKLNRFSAFICVVNSENLREFDYIKELKQRLEYMNAPIIVISRFTDRKYILKAVELGVQEYIAKPYDEEVLIRKIFGVLGAKEPNAEVPYDIDEDIITFNFSEMFNKEIKAASRGGYPMSLVFAELVYHLPTRISNENLDEITLNLHRVLSTKLRDTDSIFFLGEGRIAVILPFADKEGVKVVEDKVRNAFYNHTVMRPFSDEFEFITGAASFPEDGKVKEKLIEKAKLKLETDIANVKDRISVF